jgi:hypothetical protein
MIQVYGGCVRYIAVMVFAAAIGWAGWAPAAVLTPDPDFGGQTLGSAVTSPWTNGGGTTVVASAQSSFAYSSVFAGNGKGVNVSGSGAPYFIGFFANATPPASPILPSATGLLYFNADIRNTSAETGDYSLVITTGAAGAQRTAALYVTGNALYAEGPSGASQVATIDQGAWYNVRLTLDMTNKAYSGTVTKYGGATAIIPSRGFIMMSPQNQINCIYTDTGNVINGLTAPNHDIDNFALLTTAPPSRVMSIVNIDFNGLQGTDVLGPTYSGSGAAGGGGIFNGLTADSTTGDYLLTVSGTNLLDSFGNATRVAFTVAPVGGDVNGPGTPTTNPAASAALFGDYVYDHSTGNTFDSPFTITFLDPTIAADLYFYRISAESTITVDGATSAPFTPNSIFTNSNTMFFPNVPVINGQITGHFGNGTAIIAGLTIVSYVPEPGTVALLGLGGLGLLCWRRRGGRTAVGKGESKG